MAVCNHILHAVFDISARWAKESVHRAIAPASDGLFDLRTRVLHPESGTYDEGEAHAEVPTSSVRVCWSSILTVIDLEYSRSQWY